MAVFPSSSSTSRLLRPLLIPGRSSEPLAHPAVSPPAGKFIRNRCPSRVTAKPVSYLNAGFSGTAAPSLRGSEAPKWTPVPMLSSACPPPMPPE